MDKDGYPTPFVGRAGQRVYWHGLFPKPSKQGTIQRTGTIRHEVLWDGSTEVTLVNIHNLQSLQAFPKCCAYCTSLQRQGRP